MVREIAISIVPLFFGGLLFTALIEGYKNDMSSRKDLVVDFYRPMREMQFECRSTERQLMSAYGGVAGTYELVINELDHMASFDPATRTPAYEVIPKSLLETNSKMLTRVNELKSKLDNCTPELYRKYEEIALATATYGQFLKIAGERDSAVQSLYVQRDILINKLGGQFTPESVMKVLRDSLRLNDDTPDARNEIKEKVRAVGESIISLYLKFASNEAEIIKVEQDADNKFISLFAKEVSRRYERGVLSALWPQ